MASNVSQAMMAWWLRGPLDPPVERTGTVGN